MASRVDLLSSGRAATHTDPMEPQPHRVISRVVEGPKVVSLRIVPVAGALPVSEPGQFMMLWVFGVGEVPISVSNVAVDGSLEFTVQAVGATSTAITEGDRKSVV